MNAPKTGFQSKLQGTNQEIRKDEEQIEMRVTSNISKVKTWVSRSLATHRSAKLMGVVALGTLMITVTGLQFAPTQTEDSSFNQPVLIPGAPEALASFTPNQEVVILGEMDDDGVGGSSSYQPVLIPGGPATLAGFTPNQQVEILGEMDDDGVGDSSSYQPVLIPGAPASLAGFTPNQQVEILGEMDDDGVDGSSSYQPVLVPGAPAALVGFTPNQQVEILGEMDDF